MTAAILFVLVIGAVVIAAAADLAALAALLGWLRRRGAR
jgi:hypothetical protein